MAKKDSRGLVTLTCQGCKKKTYITSKNSDNTKEKLELHKYCSVCRKASDFKETKTKQLVEVR